MAIRPIIEVPDKRLKTVSQDIAAVTDETRQLMDDMLETMYAAEGIGLAAIQVGVAERVIVMDLSQRDRSEDADLEDDAGDPNGTDVNDGSDAVSDAQACDTQIAETGPRYFVNPKIIWSSDETRNYQEGCLSVPGFYDDVERPARCRIAYLDYDGEPQELACDGLLATCIQHEIDHLNGIVFLDHLSRLKRQIVLKKITKAERDTVRAE